MFEDDFKQPKEILARGKYLQMVRQGSWEYAERINISGIVGLIPVTDAGELVLVEQFRVPLGKRVVELPAGLAGDIAGQESEPLVEAARRELEEETGYHAHEMRRVLEGPNSAGSSPHLMTFFLATGLTKVGAGGGDEHEDIQVHVVPIKGIHFWLLEQERLGKALDPKIYAGLWFAEHPAEISGQALP